MYNIVNARKGCVSECLARLERVGFDRIDVFTRQVEAAFVKHNAFNLSGEFNLTRHALVSRKLVMYSMVRQENLFINAPADVFFHGRKRREG